MFVMTHPPYLREKARRLRTERKMSLDEIAERLALGKTTVWYWISDLPDPAIKHRMTPGRRRALAAASTTNKARFKALRDASYQRGREEFDDLEALPGFRDFVCMYIGEGYKRARGTVSLANSDPAVVALANHWICRFTQNKVTYTFQYHADQDPDELIRFWSTYLAVDPALFRHQRKSNSGQLNGRNWRSEHGVLTVRVGDTQLRARLQGWIDRVKEAWLDSIAVGA
jgi:AcrR family transcriptional regulator